MVSLIRILYKQLLCFIVLTILFLLFPYNSARGENNKNSQHEPLQLKIAVSVPILKLITQEVTGPNAEIISLTHSGEDSHHLELSPKTIMQLKKFNFFIFNGMGLDNHWVQNLKNNSSLKIKYIEASKQIKVSLLSSDRTPDPHAWHNPDNLISYLETISLDLQNSLAAQPNAKEWVSHIQKNTNSFKEKLIRWKETQLELFNKKIKDSNNIANSKSIVVLTMHSEFNYLFNFFKLPTFAIIESHNEDSLSPKSLTKNLTEIKQFKKRIFFNEEGLDPSLFKEWSTKTGSLVGGTLWGDLPKDDSKSLTLLDYLNHNMGILLKELN